MKVLQVESRMRIVEGVQTRQTDAEIARQAHCSISTVRKWRRRMAREGTNVMLLPPQMGRPRRGALSSFDPQVSQTIQHLRTTHPGWGAKTLLAELTCDEALQTVLQGRPNSALPTRASVARWLKQHARLRAHQRHQALPNADLPADQPAGLDRLDQPHQIWQMDARGHEYIPSVGVIQLINLNDVCSRVKLMSDPCQLSPTGARTLTRRPNHHDYQLALRLAFVEWGVPQAVSLDHDPVFVDASSPSPFPMALHLWLIGLGVQVHFIRVRHPTDHGLTERSHQTWYQQALQGQTFVDWQQLFAALNARRHFLNEHLPCATLHECPPLYAWPQARFPLPERAYHPAWEAQRLDMQRVDAFLAQGRWFRPVRNNGTVSLGNQVYLLGRVWRGRMLEVRFDPADRHLVFQSPAHAAHVDTASVIRRQPIRNLSAQTLLGDLHMLNRLPALQLTLPFNPRDIQVSRLFETLGVMN
jgi:transposase